MRKGVVILGVLLAGCGAGSSASDSTERGGLPPRPLRDPAEAGRSGTETRRACSLVPWRVTYQVVRLAGGRAGHEGTGVENDSLDLSICDWSARGARNVRLIVDSAPSAQLRFVNQLAEQLEYHNADSAGGQRPRQIRGVGEDSAYGGAGAWWTPDRKQLVAYARKRIVRVRVVVASLDDAGRLAVAERLARRAFAGLGGS